MQLLSLHRVAQGAGAAEGGRAEDEGSMIAEIVITALTCLALDALLLFCVAKFADRDDRKFNAKRENR